MAANQEKINLFEAAARMTPYANEAIAEVNDHVIRMAAIDGDFHWHKHEEGDECFVVLEGELHIDFEDRTVSLKAGELYTVKAGVLHRTRSNGRTVNLCFEKADNDIEGTRS
ncbi:cupin domain-containing protein [Paenibacillus thailandensis]|uniref:Cupin domain-containing protein n=1 Tax=Paenibacillus thailandensis TaxID=393250 RepID=A0ABW5QXL6_9BACL